MIQSFVAPEPGTLAELNDDDAEIGLKRIKIQEFPARRCSDKAASTVDKGMDAWNDTNHVLVNMHD